MNKLVVLLALCIFLYSCDKDTEFTDSDLSPGISLNTNDTDSLNVNAFTTNQEPIETKNLDDTWLGVIQDDRFGTSSAEIYTQFRLTNTGIDVGNNPTLDSAFFYLQYNETYGTVTDPVTIEVFELLEELNPDVDYTSDVNLSAGSNAIASLSNYSFQEFGDVIKVPLENSFANSLLSEIGTPTFDNNDNFLDFLNGVYIKTTGGETGLAKINLLNESTNLVLFYSSDTPTDSAYTFEVNTQSTRVSRYVQNFGNSEAASVINNGNTNQEDLYIVPFGGAKANVDLPNLDFLQGAVVNKAELSFYQTDFGSAENLKFPELDLLHLTLELDDSTNVTISSAGKILETIDGVQTYAYIFPITNYLQDYIDEIFDLEMSIGFHFSSSNVNSTYNVGRVKLGGGNHPTLPINLKIIYTLPN